jgi:HSP20 family molecular chaperone IbpA
MSATDRWTHYGAFERQFVIPEDVDTEQIHATCTDGILEVVVPGAAALPPARKIPVQSGKQRKALTTRGRKK